MRSEAKVREIERKRGRERKREKTKQRVNEQNGMWERKYFLEGAGRNK